MSNLGERLTEVRKLLGFRSQQAFADHLNVKRSTLASYESCTYPPSTEFLLLLKERTGANLNWIVSGDGGMFLKTITVTDLKKETVSHLPKAGSIPDQVEHSVQFEVAPASSPQLKEQMSHGATFEEASPPDTKSVIVSHTLPVHRGFQVLNPRQLRQPRNLELYKYKKGKGVPVPTPLSTVDPEAVAFIPFFNQRAAAGPGQDQMQLAETEGLIPIVFDLFGLHRPESCGIVQVTGDSMSDISLFNGDWCIFDRVDVQGDGIFVISMFGEMRVKRLQYRLSDRKIIIASENQKRYPDAEIISAEMASNGQLAIHGRVFAWFHKHPY